LPVRGCAKMVDGPIPAARVRERTAPVRASFSMMLKGGSDSNPGRLPAAKPGEGPPLARNTGWASQAGVAGG